MKNAIPLESSIDSVTNSLGRSPFWPAPVLISLVVVGVAFALSPAARAVLPAPDGGYPNENTAEGEDALFSLTTGSGNSAMGFNALYSNTTGSSNTATGNNALDVNTSGSNNTATGAYALWSNTAGNDNTAHGFNALMRNINGSTNTAIGKSALDLNENGNSNTAVGYFALFSNTNSSNNIAVGSFAGHSPTGSDKIFIGNQGKGGDSNHIRIGTNGTHRITHIAGINGSVVAEGVGVLVDNKGKLGTIVSSERFKDAIRPMDKASKAILALQPVEFRYKHELDPDRVPQFGLLAEDVEKVNPDLVARDDQGKPYSVRYEAVNAMLLNEFLKEHRTVEKQEVTITQLKTELQATATRLQKQIEALTAGLQKVSAQVEMSRAAPQMVDYR